MLFKGHKQKTKKKTNVNFNTFLDYSSILFF